MIRFLKTHRYYSDDFNIKLKILAMNIYLFWILFLALWAIVPLMIIKGKVDVPPKIKTSPEAKSKKKVGLNKQLFNLTLICRNTFIDFQTS